MAGVTFLRTSEARPAEPGPWFRAYPRAALGVAMLLFAVVLATRLAVDSVSDAISMLYTLPVALVALAFGRTAGLVAGVVAVLLVVVWVAVDGVDLSVLGWVSRALPVLLLGGLLGDASDRLSRAEAHRLVLEAAAQRQRDATEVNDTLVQGMAAAKWALEGGRTESGIKTLDETLRLGHVLVSQLLREGDMGVNGHRPPGRD
jgi:signal transduction histidine kinase